MHLKDPTWLLVIVLVIAGLGFYGLISWEIVVIALVAYMFSLGLWIDFEEIMSGSEAKTFLVKKLDNIEKQIFYSFQKLDSDDRVKTKLMKKRKEIIDWLSRF
jgi:hypothetical protein